MVGCCCWVDGVVYQRTIRQLCAAKRIGALRVESHKPQRESCLCHGQCIVIIGSKLLVVRRASQSQIEAGDTFHRGLTGLREALESLARVYDPSAEPHLHV